MASVKRKSPSKSASRTARRSAAKQPGSAQPSLSKEVRPAEIAAQARTTKSEKVLAMLRSTSGATVAAMMQETGWQQHSVRGFLAGVVRKRMKLNLLSQKAKEGRVYRIRNGDQRPKRKSS